MPALVQGRTNSPLGTVLCFSQRRALYLFALCWSFGGISALRGFGSRATSWVCCNCCFSARPVKPDVTRIWLVFTVLRVSSVFERLWVFGAHFYLPFERAPSPWPILRCGGGRSADSPFSPMEMFVRNIHIYVPHSEYSFQSVCSQQKRKLTVYSAAFTSSEETTLFYNCELICKETEPPVPPHGELTLS